MALMDKKVNKVEFSMEETYFPSKIQNNVEIFEKVKKFVLSKKRSEKKDDNEKYR